MMKALLLALLTATPALATEQDEVISAQILPGWQQSNGHHMAAISLTLAPQWKTYWRSPGDAGIPPIFDWAGSQNVKSVRVLWPSPEVFHTNGMQTIGYHDAVVLPIEVVPVDAAKPVALQARVDLGVCKDICMPAVVDLTARLGESRSADPQIEAALRDLPKLAQAAGLSCQVQPIKDGLRVTAQMVLAVQGAGETVIFEAGDPAIWVSEAQSQRRGDRLTAVADFVASGGAAFALDRSAITLTVLHQGGSVEMQGCPAP
ncbi:protein-disulfide reductase DsbD domain-containing protein [Cypionkella sp.]|jgi:DsbC/DsbD-like thiol-disulfide interchange protein|uniref:protein-disulfide reductase DsbD domain-containing protein n=1 Tax=Cypionkella sp. TaxID=2811411 RepID=UPI002FDD7F9B